MCTLVFGIDAVGPVSLVLATNRDENPARPSAPPLVLNAEPRVVGGRDKLGGGTWLAVRPPSGRRASGVALLLNRTDSAPETTGRRSRGLLALDVAIADDPRARALELAATARYAPCSLVWLSPAGSWMLSIRSPGGAELAAIQPGFHALAHHELDDPADPRTRWLAGELRDFTPRKPADAKAKLLELIRGHGGAGRPAVCLHGGRAPTVSAALVQIGPDRLEYAHAQGAPCVTPFDDFTALALPPAPRRTA